MTRLLCEREVLERTGFPSRHYLNARIRSDRFPRPFHRLRGIGDQWREHDVMEWMGTAPAGMGGEAVALRRFAVS